MTTNNQINIWGEDEILETVQLSLEDARYGDHDEELYLTGKTAEGKLVEVIVTVPERRRAFELGLA